MTKSGIYCIRNIINKKVYIGSAVNVDNRWIRHKSDLALNRHHSDHLQRAWNKYGPESFEFFVLEEVESVLLIEREQHYLTLNKSADPTYGYNICPTAGSSLGIKHSEATCELYSQIQKERYLDPDERKKTGLASQKAWKNVSRKAIASKQMKERWAEPGAKEEQSRRMKEICSTEEHRKNLSEGHIKFYSDPQARRDQMMNSPIRKEVRCIETGEVFPSINAAAKELSVSIVKIRDSANKKRVSKKPSFEWVTKDE